MFTKKILQRILAASLTVSAFTFTPPIDYFYFVSKAQAEIKTYTGVGKCVQGDLMTETQSKNLARIRAESNAKDQAGVYISSYTEVKNNNLTTNDIQVLTNDILNIVGDIQYTKSPFSNDGIPFIIHTATLKANIDTDGINAYIQRNNQLNLKSAQDDIKAGLDKIDNLIERYNQVTSQAEKDEIRTEFNQTERKVLAGQKLEQANKLANQGKQVEAIKLYNEAIEFDPNNAQAYSTCAFLYLYSQNYDLAINYYDKALKINPKDSTSYNNRSIAYRMAKNYEQAIQDCNKQIQINPNDSMNYWQRGLTYQEAQKHEQAIQDFSKAIQINPDKSSRSYYDRGKSYYHLKNYNQAILDYNRVIDSQSSLDINAYYWRAKCYQASGKTQKANTEFNNTLRYTMRKAEKFSYLYDDASYYNVLGLCYFELKQYNKAIENFSKAIECFMKNQESLAESYYNRALVYQALGDTKKAHADFEKSKKYGYRTTRLGMRFQIPKSN